jgi:hypothetical protein
VHEEIKNRAAKLLPQVSCSRAAAPISKALSSWRRVFSCLCAGLSHRHRRLVDVVNNPTYATAVGLVLHGSREQRKKFDSNAGTCSNGC